MTLPGPAAWTSVSFRSGGGPRPYCNVFIGALLVTLLLAGCVPGTRSRDPVRIELLPNFRPVTVAEAAHALEYAELEFFLATRPEQREATLSPLSGLILPAYRHVIPDIRFRASTTGLSQDADYGQIYYWNLSPLEFAGLRPGDLVIYSDGNGTVTGAGLFARWQERNRKLRMLVADQATGSASYVDWDLTSSGADLTLVAVGRLFVAAPENF